MTIYRAALAATLFVGLSSCKSDKVGVQTDEEAPRLATMVAMNDPKTATQLISGWYPAETNSWRWTAGHFAVMLRPPLGAAQSGAVLKFKFTLPDAVLSKVKTTSLSATVNGAPLSPETYTQSGEFTYTRDVPASALAGDSAKVEFALTKYLPAGAIETRELGVIASSVGFEHK